MNRAVGLRVGYLIDSLGAGGGAEQSLASLTLAMLKRGVSVDVAVLHDYPGHHQALEDAGASVTSLSGRGGRAGWLLRSAAFVRRTQPNLVHTSLFEADIAGRLGARIAGVPVVSSLVSESYGSAHLSEPALSRWRVRTAQSVDATTARLTRRLHAVSRHVADTMAHRLRYPRDRIDVVPRGRDPETLGAPSAARRAAARAGLGVAPQENLVLAVGRQEFAKGLDLLLNAVPLVHKQAPNLRVVIAGEEGTESTRLQAIVQDMELEGTVSFVGIRSDVPELLCAADVFVLPSRREGFPGVLLEAMALGVPIVATDIPQVREAVDQTTAVLSQPEISSDFARDIVGVLRDPDKALNRATRAQRRFTEHFTMERVTDAMLAFYERALCEARSAPTG